tara:strand:+ start:966 stop:1262 length:297 start_codon:yes stop_codon:yes gene_type:complete
MNQDEKKNLKYFLIKLIAVTIAIIVIINVTYNMLFADKIDSINKILLLNNKEGIEKIKDKIRSEIKIGLEKDKILSKDDALLINKFFIKIKSELNQYK